MEKNGLNRIEKAIGVLSPGAALKRFQKRMALEAYEAASKGRRTSHWKNSRNSADADLLPSLELLRNISRSMVRNNVYAFQAINTLTTNLVGTGIRPRLTMPEGNEAQLLKIQDYIERFLEKTECDFEGTKDFYGIMSLAVRSMCESGECIIVKRKYTAATKGLLNIRFQVLEPDFIDSYKTQLDNGRDNYIIQGIEYNQRGQRVAYWLYKTHPGNQYGYDQTSTRILVEDVIHLYVELRPGQQRGVPSGVSAALRLNDFTDFEDASLMKQKIASCFVAFVSGSPGIVGKVSGEGDDEERRQKLGPGIVEYMEPGEQVTFGNPPSTGDTGDFSRRQLLGAAAGYQVTYEQLTGDLSNVNFSSMRIGQLEFGKRMTEIQLNTIIPKLCERVMKWTLDAIALVESLPVEKVKYTWTPPRRELMDVYKETKAIIDQLLNGMTSWDETVTEMGFNAEQLFDKLVKERKKFADKGLKFPFNADPGTGNSAKPVEQTDPNTVDEPPAGASKAKK